MSHNHDEDLWNTITKKNELEKLYNLRYIRNWMQVHTELNANLYLQYYASVLLYSSIKILWKRYIETYGFEDYVKFVFFLGRSHTLDWVSIEWISFVKVWQGAESWHTISTTGNVENSTWKTVTVTIAFIFWILCPWKVFIINSVFGIWKK